MSIPITRVGDLSMGVCSVGAPCCPHSWISVHIQGSPIAHAHDKQIMRIGDIGISTCPHCVISYAITGSSITHADGIPVHRLGDTHIVPCGTGSVITADPQVLSE
jgi:uncharacterized Zn-binding protein involved in type VI secretion